MHLHPKAQSKLAEFLAFIANNGIQLVIETHSDHIFNGVRKSIKKQLISKDDVSVYYFKMNEDKLLSNPVKVIFDDNGIVSNHQRGLFDQFDDDLDELLGI